MKRLSVEVADTAAGDTHNTQSQWNGDGFIPKGDRGSVLHPGQVQCPGLVLEMAWGLLHEICPSRHAGITAPSLRSERARTVCSPHKESCCSPSWPGLMEMTEIRGTHQGWKVDRLHDC